MKLIIVRHGETPANKQKIIQGQLPGELSPYGRLQARLLGARLKTEPLTHIWSSPLARARETASFIAAFHPIKVEIFPELKERCFGNLEGRKFEVYSEALEESGQPFFAFRPPGGESLQSLEKRLHPMLKRLEELPPAATILIVAHGLINKIILKMLLAQNFDDWPRIMQENTCVNILTTNGRTGKLESIILNCTSHLPPSVGPHARSSQNHEGSHYENLSGLPPLPGPSNR
jgi:broad specificity phosphatase PhoE